MPDLEKLPGEFLRLLEGPTEMIVLLLDSLASALFLGPASILFYHPMS